MKASQVKGLERVYRRKVPPGEVISAELARYMTELSRETARQVGVLIDRSGSVAAVIIGDDREIVIPALGPLGRKRLRGVRCVHTHLKDEPLTEDDLTDLALLRLDLMAAVGVDESGLPATIFAAHLLPEGGVNETGYELLPPTPFHIFQMDFPGFAEALEDEMGRGALRDISDTRERAILVSVVKGGNKKDQSDSIEELKALADTQNVVVLDTLTQRPQKLNPRYLVGTGKIRELIITALRKGATMLIFDQDLSPTQTRELGLLTELKVIDRTQLILDIFAGRAHSRDGKVQVELAQLKYLLPKLSGKGTEMSRLMGGIGGRGPGETKLEVDRRRVGKRISRLEKELRTLSKGRLERRRKRQRRGVPIISIVGYTNAGKSTLLNALTQSDTVTEDKLFATLDTATRRLRFPREREAVITDTVGFIKNLPKELISAFRATLEEMEDADLLLHVVDMADKRIEVHMKVVEEILKEIGLADTPRLLVLNKADLVGKETAVELARTYDGVAASALDKSSLRELIAALGERLWPGEAAAL